MNQFPPNLDPKIYNISSVIIGFALIQNFSAAEQNAIGNWFITVGQILENNSAWQQLIEQRMNGSYLNINSKQYKQTGNPKINDNDFIFKNLEIDELKKVIEIIKCEINKMQ